MERKDKILKFFLLFSLLFLIGSCESTEEGCFDLLSTNYGFDAIGECEDCCEYPDFKISLSVVNDSILNALNDTIVLDIGDTLYFRKIELLLSEMNISGVIGNYKIRDSIETGAAYIKDDYVYFKSPSTKTVGQTRFIDTLKNLNLTVGFNEANVLSYKPFENIDISSELDSALDSLYNEEANIFYFSRIQIELQDSIRDLNLTNLDLNLDFPLNRFVSAGTDWTVPFRIDLKKLREGITADMDNEMIAETFRQNFQSSFSIE